MTSSCTRRGRGRSARRSPWTWPISFLPNLYSMPPNRCGRATTPGQEPTASRISSPGLFTHPRGIADRLGGQQLDHGSGVAATLVGGELAVGAGPLAQDRVHVLDRLSGAQIVDHIVDELEQLERQLAHRHLGLLAEVDELALQSVTDRPPLV